ncbi:MAG: hypothetical protein ACM33T_03515 [Solirubrobacterales bacterium]
MKLASTLGVALFAAAAANAADAADGSTRAEIRQHRQEAFEAAKAIEAESHQGRIQVLQEAQACIGAASTPSAYRACEQAEAAHRRAVLEKPRGERQALRARNQEFRTQIRQRIIARRAG